MRQATDYTNVAWGNWLVVRRDGTENRNACWLCRCVKCGAEQRVQSARIKNREGVICAVCSAKPPTNRSLCTDEEFIRAWQSADTVLDVCKALMGTRTQIFAIAARLRGHGVPLKKMQRTDSTKEHYLAMAELARELAKNDAD